MMFLFPIGDWVQWHSSYVLLYIGWLYLVFFLCRKALGPVLLDGRKGYFTVLGVLFLTAAATFLMSLTPVEFPRNPEYGTGLAPHIRAMWIMLIAVVSYGIPVGMLDARARRLSAQKEADETRQEKEEAVRTRAEEVVRDDDILVKSEYKTIHIPVSAIQYIEGRLKDLLEELPEGKFVRIHRSYIVPVWRIEKRTAVSVKLLGVENPLPIGRSHKNNLNVQE